MRPGEPVQFPMPEPSASVAGCASATEATPTQRFLVLVPAGVPCSTTPAPSGTWSSPRTSVRHPRLLDGTEPVRLLLRVAASTAGYIDEDCEIWSADWSLMQSRQSRYNEFSDEAPIVPGAAAEIYR